LDSSALNALMPAQQQTAATAAQQQPHSNSFSNGIQQIQPIQVLLYS
jgi:hypothetical protein